MWAMIVKEFRQLRRDRRTLAMMIVMPVILLIVFGYAASFDVTTIPTVAAGPQAAALVRTWASPSTWWPPQPDEGRAWAQTQLRNNSDGAVVAVITGSGPTAGADRRQPAVHRQDRAGVRCPPSAAKAGWRQRASGEPARPAAPR